MESISTYIIAIIVLIVGVLMLKKFVGCIIRIVIFAIILAIIGALIYSNQTIEENINVSQTTTTEVNN